MGKDIRKTRLANTLLNHGISNLYEASDVSADNEVVLVTVLLGSLGDVLVDGLHDVLELSVNLFEGPGKSLGVLAHFESGGCYAACVCSLTGSKEKSCFLDKLCSLKSGGHVSAFCNCEAAVSDKSLGVLFVELVLGSARKCNVALD